MDRENLRKMKSRVDTIIATEMADYRKTSFVKFRAGLKKDHEEALSRISA
jgi:hypothetical protein